MAANSPIPIGVALSAMLLLAGVARSALSGRTHRGLRVGVNLAAATGMVAVARAAGASQDDLGLRPERLRDGVRTAIPALLAIGGALTAGVFSPPARRWTVSLAPAMPPGPSLLFEALVRAPIATALAEEMMFRSAVLGALLTRWPPRRAVTATSLAFGLWHVPPVLDGDGERRTGASALAEALGVAAVTTAAGYVFAWLRLRGRSVLTPVLAHAATNTGGLLAAAAAHRRAR